MEENYYKEPHTNISIFNIKEKLKHYILNDYYDKLIKHLLDKELINNDDVDKIHSDFYMFVNDLS
jgi:hypothetical protein